MQWTNSIEKNVFSRSFCWALSCDILLQARLWACGQGNLSTPSFDIHPNPISTRGGQIMPTPYWCPDQVLKATGAPVLPKLFWPTVRKKCSSDWEKLFKLFKSNKMFCENAVAWKLKLSFRKELKHILAFWPHDIRLQKIRPLWWTTTYISPKAKTIQSSVLTHFTSGVSNVTVRIDIKKQNKKRIQVESSNRCVHLVWLMVQSGLHGVKSCLNLHSNTLFWYAFQKNLFWSSSPSGGIHRLSLQGEVGMVQKCRHLCQR